MMDTASTISTAGKVAALSVGALLLAPATAGGDKYAKYDAVAGPLYRSFVDYRQNRIKFCLMTFLRASGTTLDLPGDEPEDAGYCDPLVRGNVFLDELADVFEDSEDEILSRLDSTDDLINHDLEFFSDNDRTPVDVRKFVGQQMSAVPGEKSISQAVYYGTLGYYLPYTQPAWIDGSPGRASFSYNSIVGALSNNQNAMLDYTAPVGKFDYDVRTSAYKSNDFFLTKEARAGIGPFLSLRLAVLAAQTHLNDPDTIATGAPRTATALRAAYAAFQGDVDAIATRMQIRSVAASEVERAAASRRDIFASFQAVLFGALSIRADMPTDVTMAMVRSPLEVAERQTQSRMAIIDQLRRTWIDSTPTKQSWSDDGVRMTMVRITRSAHGTAAATENPVQNVVRLNLTGPQGAHISCSGALIEGNRVLTAQHCLRDERGTPYTIRSIAWEYQEICHDRAKGFAFCPASRTFRFSQIRTSPAAWRADWRNDWAVITLDEDVVAAGFEPARIADLRNAATRVQASAARVITAGYSSDLNDGREMTVHWGCGASVGKGLVQHRCNSWKGNSGGPIFAATGPLRGQIIGVVSYVETARASDSGGEARTASQGGGPSSELFYTAAMGLPDVVAPVASPARPPVPRRVAKRR